MSTTVDARIAARRSSVRRDQRRARLRRTITVVGILLALVVAILVERSSLVALAEVQVTGVERLTADAVRAAADLPLGTSTLRLRLGAAEERVEALAAVRQADVRRMDPLTVRIDVVERVPVLVVEAGGRQALVDDEGVVVASGSQPGLPVAVLPGIAAPAVGFEAAAGSALAAVIEVHRGLSGPLRTEIVGYDVRAPDDVEAVLASGPVVRLGGPDRMDEKARALGAVLEDLGDVRVGVIDVRAPRAPVVRPV